jgi:D-ribulokinase
LAHATGVQPSPRDLFVGIDLGTSGCRAVAIDGSGQLQGRAEVALPPPQRQGPAVEQDPALWWQATQDALSQLLRQIDAAAVQSIAVDGTSGTLLLADAEARPLGPALLYNDARAVAEAERIAAVASPESAAHGPTSALAKLLYLQARDSAARARHALSQADWISGLLSGRFGISDANNALKLGYDAPSRRWPSWLQQLGVRLDLLPKVAEPGTPVSRVPEFTRHAFGLSPAACIVAGTTDSTASFIATGAREPAEAVSALGSTLVMKVLSVRPIFSPGHGVYSQPLGGLWLAGGGSNSGGAVLRHYFADDQMAAMTPRLRPEQPTGLDYYPLLVPGERFPVNDPLLPPRLSPRPCDDTLFFQGLLEGMAAIEHRAYLLLAELGAPYPTSVRSTGGGAPNPAWTTIRRRLLGVPTVPAGECEAAYGTALLARQGWRSGRIAAQSLTPC